FTGSRLPEADLAGKWEFLPSGRVDVRRTGQNALAVGAEGHGRDADGLARLVGSAVSEGWAGRRDGGDVPEPSGAVRTAGEDARAVRAERGGDDSPGVWQGDGRGFRTLFGVDSPEFGLAGAHHQNGSAVGVERHLGDEKAVRLARPE